MGAVCTRGQVVRVGDDPHGPIPALYLFAAALEIRRLQPETAANPEQAVFGRVEILVCEVVGV